MRIPTLGEMIGAIAAMFALLNATGNGQMIWQQIAKIRLQAAREVARPWGCPSIFNMMACNSYERRWHN